MTNVDVNLLVQKPIWIDIDNHVLQLFYVLPISVLVFILRYIVERRIFTPLAENLGLKEVVPRKVDNNEVLEKYYRTGRDWDKITVSNMSKKVDMTERQIYKWLRLRKRKEKIPKLVKFCESAWRCLFYTVAFIYGTIVLWNKPWLWDIRQCWTDVPNQKLTSDIWWYYMIPLSFYSSLLGSQFFDVRRTDFWEMFMHHILAISLISSSWYLKYIRVGTLVLLVHDIADIFIEAAKLTHYIKYYKIRNIFFVLFVVCWVVTRLGFYPFWIIWSCITGPDPLISDIAYYIMNGLLISLQLLHCFWSYLLGKFLWISWRSGEMKKDIRSSSENEDE